MNEIDEDALSSKMLDALGMYLFHHKDYGYLLRDKRTNCFVTYEDEFDNYYSLISLCSSCKDAARKLLGIRQFFIAFFSGEDCDIIENPFYKKSLEEVQITLDLIS